MQRIHKTGELITPTRTAAQAPVKFRAVGDQKKAAGGRVSRLPGDAGSSKNHGCPILATSLFLSQDGTSTNLNQPTAESTVYGPHRRVPLRRIDRGVARDPALNLLR